MGLAVRRHVHAERVAKHAAKRIAKHVAIGPSPRRGVRACVADGLGNFQRFCRCRWRARGLCLLRLWRLLWATRSAAERGAEHGAEHIAEQGADRSSKRVTERVAIRSTIWITVRFAHNRAVAGPYRDTLKRAVPIAERVANDCRAQYLSKWVA